MKRGLIFLAFAVILIFANLSVINSVRFDSNVKIDNAVYEKLQHEGKVKVFINLKNEAMITGLSGKFRASGTDKNPKGDLISDFSALGNSEFKLRYDFGSSIAVEVSADALELLKSDERVESIQEDAAVHAFLQDSIPLINATLAWPIKVNGTNLTGETQTICIIDTGVNYSNTDLGGCFGNNTDFSCKVIAGYDYVNDDKNPDDDNGHGTHVAGIAAANGTIQGVAPDARIVAIKVLDADGNGVASDIAAGIQWCVSNSSIFNISVISMSLGTVNLYTSYCDNLSTALTNAVDNATAINITVVAATGNSGSTTSIANPACIRNATSVGATTKADAVDSSYSNRNNITTILAPGTGINSTRSGTLTVGDLCSCSGNYCTCSGTSMSTPHVSGAIALLKQYKNLEKNTSLTTVQIKDVLNRTGKRISDSGSGLVFSRINVFAALVGIDETAPIINISQPQNITYATNTSLALNFTVSDNLNRSNCWYSIDAQINITLANCANTTLGATEGSHNLSLYANDSAGNLNVSSVVFNINFNPVVNLLLPANSTLNSTNETQTFSCNASDSSGLQNITLYVWNSTAEVNRNSTNLSGETYNQTNFSYALPYEGVFKWNCRATDNESNYASANNYTITFWDYNISECRNITLAGNYIMNKSITNWAGSGACINILTSDVALDCQNYAVDGVPGLGYPYSYYGIQFNQSSSQRFSNITVKNCMLSDWVAAAVQGMQVENSTIFNNTLYSNQNGIEFISSNYNTISNNNITSAYYSGLLLTDSSHNMIIGNNLSFNNSNGIIFDSYSQNNTFINNSVKGGNNYDINITNVSIKITNPEFGRYAFSDVSLIIEDSSYARINFPNVTQNGTNFSADVVLRSNYIFVNSSKTGLNRSANLSLYGLSFSNPRILRDGSVCPSSICTKLSYTSSNGTLIFNVTGFSSYSAEETPTTQQTASSSGGGGGGGGTAAGKTYSEGTLSESKEVNRLLEKNDKIKFTLREEEHNLTVKSVTSENATFELNSTSLKFTLSAGESRKFNLTDEKFYDLLIKLNSISNLKTNLSINAIFEMIPIQEKKPEIENISEKVKPEANAPGEKEAQSIAYINKKIVLLVWVSAGSVALNLLVLLILLIAILKYYEKQNKLKWQSRSKKS